MDYPTLDEIKRQLKSMVAEFFDDLDQAYKQGIDLPQQSQLFLETFPHFQLEIKSDSYLPREAAISKWLHDSWAKILGDLNPNLWQKTPAGQYPKSNATNLVRCVVAHMRWLGRPNTATKQRWTGAELAKYFQTPQLILNEYTQITGIRTDDWIAASLTADLERLFSTSSAKSNLIDPGPWNTKIREGEELVFGIQHRAREICKWVRDQPRVGPIRAVRIVRIRPSSQLTPAHPIANETFQQLLPPQNYALLRKYSPADYDDDLFGDETVDAEEVIDPFIIMRPDELRRDDIPRQDSKSSASNQNSSRKEKLAHLNSLLIRLLHQKSASQPFPFYEVILEQSVVQSVINGPSKAMLVGETGSGRTTAALLIAAQKCNSPDFNQAAVVLDFKGGKNKLHIQVSNVPRMIYTALSERQQSELKDYSPLEINKAIEDLLDAELLLPIFDHTEWLSDINKSVLAKSLTQLNRFLVIVHRDDVAVFINIGATEVEMPAPSEFEIADYFVRKSDHIPGESVPGIKKMLARLPAGVSPWQKLVVACNHREKYWAPSTMVLDAYLEFTVRAADIVGFHDVPQKLETMKRLAGRIALAVCKEDRAITAKFDKQDFDKWAELQGVASNINNTLREMWFCGWLRRDEDGWRFADAEIAAHCAAPFWLKEFENDKDGRLTMGAEWVPIIAAAADQAKIVDDEKLAKLDKKALKRLNRMAMALVSALKGRNDDYLVELSVKLKSNLDPNVTITLPTRQASGYYLLAQLKQLVEMDGSDIERLEFVNHQLRDLDHLIWGDFILPHFNRVKQMLLAKSSRDDSEESYIARVVRLLDFSEGELFFHWQHEQLHQRDVAPQTPFGLLPEDDIGLRNICFYARNHFRDERVIEKLESLFVVVRHWQEEIVAQLMRDASADIFALAMDYALRTDCIIVRKPENTLDLVKQYGGFISIARATERLNELLTSGISKWTREISFLYRLCALSDAHRAKDVLAKVAPYKPEY